MKKLALTVALLASLVTPYVNAANVVSLSIRVSTKGDDKDKDDEVKFTVIQLPDNILKEFGPVGRGVRWAENTADHWQVKLDNAFQDTQCKSIRLRVWKSGSKGWTASFNVVGTTDNNKKLSLLSETGHYSFGDRGGKDKPSQFDIPFDCR